MCNYLIGKGDLEDEVLVFFFLLSEIFTANLKC